MNSYVFDVCFNPAIDEDNIFLFIDHCLAHLSNSFFSDGDGDSYFASRSELPGGLDPERMKRYWQQHRELIRQRVLGHEERQVVTSNYIAYYHENLAGVFRVLDEMIDERAATEGGGDELSSTPP
ncbi:TPA: hypothetical protein ACUT4C_005291 [Pseudomonas aeruginosa]